MSIHATSVTRKIVGAFVGFLCLCCTQSVLSATEIRTVAQYASEPKFVALDANGGNAIGGLCIDILRAIERVDPTLKFIGDQTWQPLPRIEAGLGNGQLDAVCALLPEGPREVKYTFIEPPVMVVNFYLVARADDDVQIANWDDVRRLGKQGVILAVHGIGILRKLREEGGLQIDAGAYTAKGNLGKLLAGRGRFYYRRSPGLETEIRTAGMTGKVKILPAIMQSEQWYMVLSKTVPADTADRIRQAIGTLKTRGELEQIQKKWAEY
jgi:glutamate/aspartate transport system substrate-binding protein